jgi:hypothetical protein
MFMQYLPYQVLICCEHRCAVYGLDKHLERHYAMPAAARRALLTEYEDFDLLPPAEVSLPLPYSYPITELGPAQDVFLIPGRQLHSALSGVFLVTRYTHFSM